jgi:hypothetical protein
VDSLQIAGISSTVSSVIFIRLVKANRVVVQRVSNVKQDNDYEHRLAGQLRFIG